MKIRLLHRQCVGYTLFVRWVKKSEAKMFGQSHGFFFRYRDHFYRVVIRHDNINVVWFINYTDMKMLECYEQYHDLRHFSKRRLERIKTMLRALANNEIIDERKTAKFYCAEPLSTIKIFAV